MVEVLGFQVKLYPILVGIHHRHLVAPILENKHQRLSVFLFLYKLKLMKHAIVVSLKSPKHRQILNTKVA